MEEFFPYTFSLEMSSLGEGDEGRILKKKSVFFKSIP